MTKLDWEKQNRRELFLKRLHKKLDENEYVPSMFESWLMEAGIRPTTEAINSIKDTESELKREWKEIRSRLLRKEKKNNSSYEDQSKFLKGELVGVYVSLLSLRLLSHFPDQWRDMAK